MVYRHEPGLAKPGSIWSHQSSLGFREHEWHGDDTGPYTISKANHDAWQRQFDECLFKGAQSMKIVPRLKNLSDVLSAEISDADVQISLSGICRNAVQKFAELWQRICAGEDIRECVSAAFGGSLPAHLEGAGSVNL